MPAVAANVCGSIRDGPVPMNGARRSDSIHPMRLKPLPSGGCRALAWRLRDRALFLRRGLLRRGARLALGLEQRARALWRTATAFPDGFEARGEALLEHDAVI